MDGRAGEPGPRQFSPDGRLLVNQRELPGPIERFKSLTSVPGCPMEAGMTRLLRIARICIITC